jgi:hypothetical protein
MRIILIIVLAIMLLGKSKAQCVKGVSYVKTDSCKFIAMDTLTWARYFIAEKNLRIIDDEVSPKLHKEIDSLYKIHEELRASHLIETTVREAKSDTVTANFEEVLEIALDLQERNGELYKKNEDLKKWFKRGTIGSALIGLLVGILIAK